MLLPTVENNTPALKQQRKSTASDVPFGLQQATQENPTLANAKQASIESIDDKAAKQPKQETLQELAPATFNTESTDSYPDYTLELTHSKTQSPLIKPAELRPDEIRHGRKRPALPLTFGFGLRRSQAVAVAMRYPLLEGRQPSSAAQAILDTLDLAATNRLPYIKGSAINLAA